MNGRLAKTIRRELVPKERLQELSKTMGRRISRGEFLRMTTAGSNVQVRKESFNKNRVRYKWIDPEDHSKGVRVARHTEQYRLDDCPRLAIKRLKENINGILRNQRVAVRDSAANRDNDIRN